MNPAIAATARTLRAEGHAVGVGQLLAAHRALATVDAGDRDAAYRALRATLCCDRRSYDAFPHAFLCATAPAGADGARDVLVQATHARPLATGSAKVAEARAQPDPGDAPLATAWSERELLRRKDFAALTDAELADVRRAVRALARGQAHRRGRRRVAARPPARGDRIDVRATLRDLPREQLGGGGAPRTTRRGTTARPLVLVLDVSGSMTPYARVLLHYAHTLVRARRRVEAFAFATRLTRVTAALAREQPDAALARVAAEVTDRGGGTRIGDALGALNRRWSGVVGRGATVVVLSDGCDRGEPARVGAETARLARTAHALVWVNPLSGQPDYQPLQRGMAAALPHVDRLLAGSSLAGVAALAQLLEEEL